MLPDILSPWEERVRNVERSLVKSLGYCSDLLCSTPHCLLRRLRSRLAEGAMQLRFVCAIDNLKLGVPHHRGSGQVNRTHTLRRQKRTAGPTRTTPRTTTRLTKTTMTHRCINLEIYYFQLLFIPLHCQALPNQHHNACDHHDRPVGGSRPIPSQGGRLSAQAAACDEWRRSSPVGS